MTSALERVLPLVNRAREQQERVERLEAELKAAKAALRRILDVELPELMDELGLEQVRTKDGAIVEVREVVDARIPRAKAEQALAWLKEHGYGDLIKHEVVARFGAGDEARAELVREAAEQAGAAVQVKETVHPQTLKAWARERLAEGEVIPEDLFGLYIGRTVKIKEPKEV